MRSPHDLEGARAAWVDRQSVSGYLLIRAHLRSLGIMPERAFTSDRFFGSHEAVVRAVVDGSADVGATFIHLDERPGRREPRILRAGWGDAKVRVIAHAGPIPSDVVAASTRLGAGEARLVQDAWGSHAVPRCQVQEGLNHFSIVDALAKPGHDVHHMALILLRA